MKRRARRRGIEVHPAWAALHGFDAFFRDMGERPEGLVLGRVSLALGYSPDNCRWMTRGQAKEMTLEERRAAKRAAEAGRPSPALVYTPRWQIVSREYRKAHPLCECDDCAALPENERPPSTEVHHRDGLGPSGPRGFDWDNLQAMAKPCHSRQTVREHGLGATSAEA